MRFLSGPPAALSAPSAHPQKSNRTDLPEVIPRPVPSQESTTATPQETAHPPAPERMSTPPKPVGASHASSSPLPATVAPPAASSPSAAISTTVPAPLRQDHTNLSSVSAAQQVPHPLGSNLQPHHAVSPGNSHVSSTALQTALTIFLEKVTVASAWTRRRGLAALSHAMPWDEFFNVIEFGPSVEPGSEIYVERLRANFHYFTFNYLVICLIMTAILALGKPWALVGVAIITIACLYLFGSDMHEEEPIFGMILLSSEKLAVLAVFAFIALWITSGSLTLFVTALAASMIVCVLHGTLRNPPHAALQMV